MSNLDYYFIDGKKISDTVAHARSTTPGKLKIRLSDLGYHGPNAEVYLINPYRNLEKSVEKGDPNVAAWGSSATLEYYYSKISNSKENKLIFVDKKDAPYPRLLENFQYNNRFCPFEYMDIMQGNDVDGPIEIWYSTAKDCCYYKRSKDNYAYKVDGRGMFVALQGAGGAGGAASGLGTLWGEYVKGGAGGGGGAFGIFYLNLSIHPDGHYKVYIGKGGKGENGKPGGHGEPSKIDINGKVVAFCAGGEGGEYGEAQIDTGSGTIAKGGSGGMLPSPNSFPEVSLLVASKGGKGGDGGANKYNLFGAGSGLTEGADGEACPNRFDFSLPIDTSLSFSYSRWWNWIYNNKRLGSPIGKNNAAGRSTTGGQSCSGGGGGGGAFMCLGNASSESFVDAKDNVLKNIADGYGAGGAGGSAGFSHADAGMDGRNGCFAILTPTFY